jgi:hypothetical protein
MFCTGAAPTVPGISARFSSPGQPCSSVQRTSRASLAGADLDHPGVGVARATRRRPITSTRSTTAGGSRLSTRLLPPPSTSLGATPSSGWSSTRRTSASRVMRTSVCCGGRQAEGVEARAGSRHVRWAALDGDDPVERCMRAFSPSGRPVLDLIMRGDDPRHMAEFLPWFPCLTERNARHTPCPASIPSSSPISSNCAMRSTSATRKSAPASTSRAPRAKVESVDKRPRTRSLHAVRRQRLPARPGARRAAGQAQQTRRRHPLPRLFGKARRRWAATSCKHR